MENDNRKFDVSEAEVLQVTGGRGAPRRCSNDYWDRVWCDSCLMLVEPKEGFCPYCGKEIQ